MGTRSKRIMTLGGIIALATVLGNNLGLYLGDLYVSAKCFHEPIFDSAGKEIRRLTGCEGMYMDESNLILWASIVGLVLFTLVAYLFIKKFWRKK